jgi:hypothetical protein
MILISHRGNLTGSQPELENRPSYIQQALEYGFNVEIDVWFIDGKFKLGHDEPQYDFPFELFENYSSKLWIHCKNIDALVALNEFPSQHLLNYFWHQEDDITLTSKGYIWAYPGKQPIKNSIAVMPELNKDDLTQAIGICSDYIENYKI